MLRVCLASIDLSSAVLNFIVSYVGYRLNHWRNVEVSCHKHFVVVSRHQQTPQLTTNDKCHNLPRSGGTVSITPSGRGVDSTR